MPSHNSKYYVQCIKTKTVKFHIIITEMEQQQTTNGQNIDLPTGIQLLTI